MGTWPRAGLPVVHPGRALGGQKGADVHRYLSLPPSALPVRYSGLQRQYGGGSLGYLLFRALLHSPRTHLEWPMAASELAKHPHHLGATGHYIYPGRAARLFSLGTI